MVACNHVHNYCDHCNWSLNTNSVHCQCRQCTPVHNTNGCMQSCTQLLWSLVWSLMTNSIYRQCRQCTPVHCEWLHANNILFHLVIRLLLQWVIIRTETLFPLNSDSLLAVHILANIVYLKCVKGMCCDKHIEQREGTGRLCGCLAHVVTHVHMYTHKNTLKFFHWI